MSASLGPKRRSRSACASRARSGARRGPRSPAASCSRCVVTRRRPCRLPRPPRPWSRVTCRRRSMPRHASPEPTRGHGSVNRARTRRPASANRALHRRRWVPPLRHVLPASPARPSLAAVATATPARPVMAAAASAPSPPLVRRRSDPVSGAAQPARVPGAAPVAEASSRPATSPAATPSRPLTRRPNASRPSATLHEPVRDGAQGPAGPAGAAHPGPDIPRS